MNDIEGFQSISNETNQTDQPCFSGKRVFACRPQPARGQEHVRVISYSISVVFVLAGM